MKMAQKNAYDRMMSRYDDVLTGRKWWSWLYMHWLWGVDDNEIARKVLSFIPDDFEGKILDVPVGTMVFTHAKYQRMTNAEIVGLDYSEEMIRFASLRKKSDELHNLTLVRGDVGDMPFEDGCFDCVLTMNGIHAFPDKEKAFAEIFRVLKPSGRLCGCFYVEGERGVGDWFVRNVLNRRGYFVPPHYTLSEVEKKLRSLFGENVQLSNNRSICLFRCVKSK
ncbi:ubiquinone biosynthesis methyltransferase UbiE [Bacteroides zoogleoformans]|nr:MULTISPECIES: methyltransferase domain-containing protein [Bacteroides]AVM54032.1 ubiquinone biosynthesis methyltransferase UbiE [Bacteroides zoogleoformans]